MGYATIDKNGKFTGTVYKEITEVVQQWHIDNDCLWLEVVGDSLPNMGTDDSPDYGNATAEQIKTAKINTIGASLDMYIDSVAKAKGYGTNTMSPTAACIAYVGYDNPYRVEAESFAVWKASIWPIVFQIQADVESGSIPEPTLDEIIAQLPVMVWSV